MPTFEVDVGQFSTSAASAIKLEQQFCTSVTADHAAYLGQPFDHLQATAMLNGCSTATMNLPGGEQSTVSINDGEVAICAQCAGKIVDQVYLSAVDRKWHVNCLRCTRCTCSLATSSTFFWRSGSAYCRDDYYKLMRHCAGCEMPIMTTDLIMPLVIGSSDVELNGGRQYQPGCILLFHVDCFKCAACSRQLQPGEQYFTQAGRVFCENHHDFVINEPLLQPPPSSGIPSAFQPPSPSSYMQFPVPGFIDSQPPYFMSSIVSNFESPMTISAGKSKTKSSSSNNKSSSKSKSKSSKHRVQAPGTENTALTNGMPTPPPQPPLSPSNNHLLLSPEIVNINGSTFLPPLMTGQQTAATPSFQTQGGNPTAGGADCFVSHSTTSPTVLPPPASLLTTSPIPISTTPAGDGQAGILSSVGYFDATSTVGAPGQDGGTTVGMSQHAHTHGQGRQKRIRTSFKHTQLKTMKQYFCENHNPDAKDLKNLALKTGLTKRVLQVWFQNARAKYRRNIMKEQQKMANSGDGISGAMSIAQGSAGSGSIIGGGATSSASSSCCSSSGGGTTNLMMGMEDDDDDDDDGIDDDECLTTTTTTSPTPQGLMGPAATSQTNYFPAAYQLGAYNGGANLLSAVVSSSIESAYIPSASSSSNVATSNGGMPHFEL